MLGRVTTPTGGAAPLTESKRTAAMLGDARSVLADPLMGVVGPVLQIVALCAVWRDLRRPDGCGLGFAIDV